MIASARAKHGEFDAVFRSARRLPAVAGVYLMVNRLTGDSYVGSSEDVRRRAGHWASAIKHGSKECVRNAAHPHGFEFELIEACEHEMLERREQFHIRDKRPSLNRNPVAMRCRDRDQIPAPTFDVPAVVAGSGSIWWCGSIRQSMAKLVAEGLTPMQAASMAIDGELESRRRRSE